MGRGQQAAQGSLGNCAGQQPRGSAPVLSRMERAGEPSDPKDALTTTYPPQKNPTTWAEGPARSPLAWAEPQPSPLGPPAP